MTVRLWYLGKPFPLEIATFEEIRLEIERTLAKVQESEDENKRFLLRRLYRLIILADETVSANDKRNPHANNVFIRRRLATLRSLVVIALNAE